MSVDGWQPGHRVGFEVEDGRRFFGEVVSVEPGEVTLRAITPPAVASELARLRRTVGTVRDLHPRVSISDNLGRPLVACGSCSDRWGDPASWPCPTVRALDEEAA